MEKAFSKHRRFNIRVNGHMAKNMALVYLNTKINIHILGSLGKTLNMVQVFMLANIQGTKEIGSMGKNKAKEFKFSQMEIIIKDNLLKEKLMDKASINGKINHIIKAPLEMDLDMAKDNGIDTTINKNILASISMIGNVDRETIIGKMVAITKADSLMD